MYASNTSCNFYNITFIHTVPIKEIYFLILPNKENTEILSRREGD
jgi:hypothetical protein